VRLTTKGRYAVMAMVDLAQHSDGEPVALADVADRQGISLSYLEQLFQKLRRANLVKSVRGPGGGYLLFRDSLETPISEVIAAVDEPLRATRCAPGGPLGCTGGIEKCLTHDLWEELSDQIQLFLNSVTLYDVVQGRVRREIKVIGGTAA
jgi:Rrf2 family iron-sulfur cluster assembly transcriptional regulator